MQYPTTRDSKPMWDNKKLITLLRNLQQLAHFVGGGFGADEGGGPPTRLSPPAPKVDPTCTTLLMSVGSNSLIIVGCELLGMFRFL